MAKYETLRMAAIAAVLAASSTSDDPAQSGREPWRSMGPRPQANEHGNVLANASKELRSPWR